VVSKYGSRQKSLDQIALVIFKFGDYFSQHPNQQSFLTANAIDNLTGFVKIIGFWRNSDGIVFLI